MENYGLQTGKLKINKLSIAYALFMFLLTIIGLQIATQYVAYHLQFNTQLGGYWIVNGYAMYPFWNVIVWGMIENVVVQNVVDKGMEFFFMIFVFPQVLVLLLLLNNTSSKGNAKLHGSAKWASRQEIEKMGFFGNEGVYVGSYQKNLKGKQKYLMHDGPEHILCFAPTRSGKGVGLILPTLLEWKGSSIVLDIKSENWALTSGYRKSLGHKVLRFDPTDTTGSACRFNPLEEIRLNTLHCVQDVQNMAMMIVDPEGKGLSDHWTKAAFAFFSGIILHCAIMIKANKNRFATLQDLVLMLSGYEQSTKELLMEMCDTKHGEELEKIFPNIDKEVGNEAHAFIASTAMEMKNKAEAEASGVISSALVNMALYRDPIINLNTSSSDFRIHDLMNFTDPVDLYLVLSPESIDRMRPLIRLMLDMIVRRICKEMSFKDGTSVKGYTHRCLFMLDEFTSLGKLPILEKAIAYMASYGGKMYLVVQDLKQLNGVYGKENALMANCHVRIAYAPNDNETAKLLSEMTGNTTVVDKKISTSYSKSGISKSVNFTETARPLLTSDECTRLPAMSKHNKAIKAGHMLIFTAGQNPIYGVQILYFQDKIFMARARIPASGTSETYPLGITDSIYFPRPDEWYTGKKTIEVIETPKEEKEECENEFKKLKFEDFLED